MTKLRKIVGTAKMAAPRQYNNAGTFIVATITATVDLTSLSKGESSALVAAAKDQIHGILHDHPFRYLHSEIQVK